MESGGRLGVEYYILKKTQLLAPAMYLYLASASNEIQPAQGTSRKLCSLAFLILALICTWNPRRVAQLDW